jgi:AcrR family transcriptional regulator
MVVDGPARRRSSVLVRRLILHATRELLAEKTPGVTVAEIAERAGVSPTALFRHFGDKANLIAVAQADSVDEVEPDPSLARDKLRTAARDLFSKHGYSNTSTRRIAEQAGVPETAVFRTFGTKAALFRAAVFEPFGNFLSEFAAQWSANKELHSVDTITRGYIGGLYQLLREHGSIAAVALLAARAHEGPDLVEVGDQQAALGEVIQALEKLCAAESAYFGYDELNVAFATRISIAMALATAVFKEWLFDDTIATTDDEIAEELTKMLLHGIAQSSTVPTAAAQRELIAARQRIAELEAQLAQVQE